MPFEHDAQWATREARLEDVLALLPRSMPRRSGRLMGSAPGGSSPKASDRCYSLATRVIRRMDSINGWARSDFSVVRANFTVAMAGAIFTVCFRCPTEVEAGGVDARAPIGGKSLVDWLTEMYSRGDNFPARLRRQLDR